MRRAPIVLSATVVGFAAALGIKPHKPTTTSTAVAATATATSTSSSKTKTATGDAVDTQYGAAQVRVTVSNGKITKIEALQLQGNDPKSVAISTYAEPYLRQSALRSRARRSTPSAAPPSPAPATRSRYSRRSTSSAS